MATKQLALVIDLDRCIGCCGCEVSCKQENEVAVDVVWNKVVEQGPYGTFPDVEHYFLPSVCQQCAVPQCVKVCPTGASYINRDGIVLINREKCLGCKYCIMACPYGVRSFNRETKVVEKCTLCVQLQAVDEKPACVKACAAKARFFGDLGDPDSDASRVLREAGEENVHSLPDVGNHPKSRYILHPKMAAWRS
ncbi:MAG: 4Fe-4S dicluster domain-containing protein [Acidobacteriota bacterium]|jgi:Fe-S-cluster-containing dehydrogenase component|nr:4Fe-4S dicluster domain-containing protein [Acidobacteriota bacterium]